ncbi:PWWP domain-containing protein2 [Escovopsis weberi]|uniref:PWWP domain-containing protein2 n=1 Tax=Escovopsis weberi TaxID=150374 RepID=A0A0M9VUW4_ESCWE|nr:PWWP domain-containing protein2 [Escovopsis weberi]
MADTAPEKTAAAAPVASADEAPAALEVKITEEKKLVVRDDSGKVEDKAAKKETKGDVEEPKEPEAAEKPSEVASEEKPEEEKVEEESEKKAAAVDEAETKDAAAEAEGEADTTIAAETPTASKSKNRRKSAGDVKGKTLSKKGSKARLTHLDAQPGDHFLVKLKGFPAWPAIICDEPMLPHALVSSRPVSAARPDGSYAEAYAEGGKRVHDRTFPVMYLYTNEFGWVANTALTELTAEKARDTITEKMRKDLKAAFELAAEQNSVEHYKDILVSFQEELIAQEEARKEAAATPKKSKKSKAAKVSNEYDDVEMADADEVVKPKPKKRKAEEDASTPQRSDSVKKPKIKLNTSSTPKAANGTPTAKAKDAAASKTAKAKTKKGKDIGDKKAEAPKEAKMTPEERHARKEASHGPKDD